MGRCAWNAGKEDGKANIFKNLKNNRFSHLIDSSGYPERASPIDGVAWKQRYNSPATGYPAFIGIFEIFFSFFDLFVGSPSPPMLLKFAVVAAGLAVLVAVRSTAHFTITVNVKAPADSIIEFVKDLPRFTTLHPLTVSCTPVKGNEGSYVIIDRISMFGIWESKIIVEATMNAIEPHVLVATTRTSSRVTTKSIWRFKEEKESAFAVVSEEFSITAPLLLLHYSCWIAKRAHENLMVKMKQEMEKKQQ